MNHSFVEGYMYINASYFSESDLEQWLMKHEVVALHSSTPPSHH